MLSEMGKCIEKMQKINAKNEHDVFDIEQYKKIMQHSTDEDIKEFRERLGKCDGQ